MDDEGHYQKVLSSVDQVNDAVADAVAAGLTVVFHNLELPIAGARMAPHFQVTVERNTRIGSTRPERR